MSEKLRILLLEDVPEDAELIERQLCKDEIAFTLRHAETREGFSKELGDFKPDLVIADYSLPDFTGLDAINLVQEHTPSTPVIICTGSIGEDAAVECIKAGAADYVIKTRMARLGSAVKGALEKRQALEEKERAEQARREEHEYVRNLIESSIDMIIAVDNRRRITEFNRAAEESFSYSSKEVLGKHVNLLYADPKEGLAVHKKTVMNGRHVQEILNRRKDGTTFPALLSSSLLLDSDGNRVGVMGVSRDITLQKQDEELLQFQADVLANVQDSVIVTNLEDKIIYWDSGATNLYGYTVDEMIGQNPIMLYPEQDPDHYAEKLKSIIQGDELTGAWKGRRKDGSDIWVAMKMTLAQDATGNPIGFIGVTRDITARVQAEEQLKISDQIISHIDNLVLVFKEGGKVVFTGPSITRVLGCSITEVLGDGWCELIFRDDNAREREKEYINAAIKDRRKIRSEPYERQTYDKDGRPHWILWQDTKGPGDTLIEIGHDITEYKNLESHLNQAEKLRAIGELAAGIAHEINSPIQYIGDNLRFIENSSEKILYLLNQGAGEQEITTEHGDYSKDSGNDKIRLSEEDINYLTEEIPPAIRQSLEGVARVSEIVQAMKGFSHPGGEEKTPLDLNQIIKGTVTVARNEWKYVAEMVTDLAPDLPLVPCLSGELKQVILNLMINAAHAIEEANKDESTAEKGTISISTRRDGENVEIRISDTGTGIPEKIQSRIFEPFFTTKEVGRGTGQGLTIAHSVIVEKHGGTITFECKERKGTTFIIRLPVNAVPE